MEQTQDDDGNNTNSFDQLISSFPIPPNTAPMPKGWSAEYDDSFLTSDLKQTETNNKILDLFTAFSTGRISDDQLIHLHTTLSSLEPLSLTKYTLLGIEQASKDLSVLQRTNSSPSTPRNKGMRTRMKGFFKGAANAPIVRLDTALLNFGDTEMNTKKRQTLVIYNDGKHKFFFKPEEVVFPGTNELSHKLTFIPEDPSILMEGDHIVVRKKQSAKLHIELTVLQSGPIDLVAPFALRFASGPLLFALGKTCVLSSFFGVNPAELECIEDTIGSTTRLIPSVLVQMRYYLYQNDGLDIEGIFRIAADENEMPTVRNCLNRGTFVSCNDINCISTLIKVFFRQLPRPLLADIPTEQLLNITNELDSQAALEQLNSTSKVLLEWIVDLMCDVVQHRKKNKMSSQSCSIVMGPNLFSNRSDNPMQALMMSQKAVTLLKHLIDQKCEQNNK